MSQYAETYILDAARSPIGRAHKGALVGIRPDDLGADVLNATLDENKIDGNHVDELIAGCGYPFGEQGYNVARTVGLLSQMPINTPAHTVSKLCASSLQAVRTAAHAVELGESQLVAVIGLESISRVGRDNHLRENNPRLDPQEPGPTIADLYLPMVRTAENVAVEYDVSRREMDEYAQQSHERAVRAQRSGFFASEIVPVTLPDGSVVRDDDGPRPSSSVEKLAGLEPVLPDGIVTAGNSCPLNDGAAAVLVGTWAAAERLGVKPRAKVIASGLSALDPTIMGMGPVGAVGQVLERAALDIEQIDLLELNEAFASQVIASARELSIDPAAPWFNPQGGAIALGHPFGMTGARMIATLLNGLDACDGRYGIVTMCVGGGQGQAMLVERVV